MSDGSLRYDAIFEGIFKSEVLLDYDISRITENKIRICLKYVLYTHSYTKSEKQYIIDFANNFMDGRNIRDDGPYLKWNSKKLRLERNLAINIINGIRPKIPNKFPEKFKKLLNQCWDANPDNRPDAKTLWIEVKEILRDLYNTDQNLKLRYSKSRYKFIRNLKNNFNRLSNATELIKSLKITINFTDLTSKHHHFSNLPTPKNASREQQEGKNCYYYYYVDLAAYHTKQNDLVIPDGNYKLYWLIFRKCLYTELRGSKLGTSISSAKIEQPA
ncbi:9261_t:CDS:2 [Entrophospora sp. SA101]|nr:9261_t:CDS:2 [Entrophospora sp. SA101]